jgi:hypothetical protein
MENQLAIFKEKCLVEVPKLITKGYDEGDVLHDFIQDGALHLFCFSYIYNPLRKYIVGASREYYRDGVIEAFDFGDEFDIEIE